MSLSFELIEQSFEKIRPNAQEFAASFYQNLFLVNPELYPLFAHKNMEEQKEKLINSLVLVVLNIRYPQNLNEALQGLGARHVEYGALPEHYPMVGNALLKTFKQYLKEDWTEELKQAWIDAYEQISTLMLEGAEYNPANIQLESAPVKVNSSSEFHKEQEKFNKTTKTRLPKKPITILKPVESEDSSINFLMIGGIFGGAGLVTILLLLLL